MISAQEVPGLPDQLTLLRKLGSGAFGTVYEAFDRDRGASVALKVLQRAEPRAVYQFKREFRGLVDLAHPNLVSLHELFTVRAGWAFTMELIAGVSFRSYVLDTEPVSAEMSPTASQTGPTATTEVSHSGLNARSSRASLTTGRVMRVRAALAQLTDALRALHSSGKLHCDLKPSNVLVSPEGRVVVVDFGLVRELGLATLDSNQRWGGTPRYMAPEQAAGELPTEASDWYSVGVMLFEALTGRVPFAGGHNDVLATKQTFEAPPPSFLVSGVPRDLDLLCSALLRVEPAERPDGQQIERIVGSTGRPRRVGLPTPMGLQMFVGRQEELLALEEAFAAVRHGEAERVTVGGESGVGKSTLVHRFLQRLQLSHPEAIILAGQCHAHDGIPYMALDGLMDALSRHLNRLGVAEAGAILGSDHVLLSAVFPVLGSVQTPTVSKDGSTEPDTSDAGELRQRLSHALRSVLRRLAMRAPLVLFVDDLQWGDADSAFILSGALRGPEAPPLLFVACTRRARETQEGRYLSLEGLTPDEAGSLARALLRADGAETDLRIQAITAESAGSPYLIHELVQIGLEEPHASPPPARRGGAGVEELVRARIASLPPLARRYLELVAVAGHPLQLRVVRAAARLPAAEEQIVAMLRAQRLLRSGESRRPSVEPYHDRIRQAVLATLGSDVLRTHHRELAAAWEQSGDADAEVLAIHHEGAGNLSRAAELALQAAAQASKLLAFDHAAKLYRQALRLEPQRQVAGVRRALAEALVNAGQVEEAASEYLTCAAGASLEESLTLKGLAAGQLLRGGRTERGLELLRGVLDALGVRIPRTRMGVLVSLVYWRLRAALQERWRPRAALAKSAGAQRQAIRADGCWTLAHGLAIVDVLRASVFQARYLVLARALGDQEHLVRALALETARSGQSGSLSRARTRALSERARRAALQAGEPKGLAMVELSDGCVAFCEGRWRDAADQLARAEAMLVERCVGQFWELSTARMFACASLVFTGDFRRLKQRLSSLLESARGRGNLYEVASLSFRSGHSMLLAEDRPEDAGTQLREALSLWPQGRFYSPHWWACMGNAEIALYVGEPGAAMESLKTGWASLRASRLLAVQYVRITARFRRAHCALATARGLRARSERRERLRAAEHEAQRLSEEGAAWARPLSGLLHAGILAARGMDEAALGSLVQAEQELQAVDMRLHAAAARGWRGELQGGPSGRSLVEESDLAFRAEGVMSPARMRRMLVPAP